MFFVGLAPFITPAIIILCFFNAGVFVWTFLEISKLKKIIYPQGNRRLEIQSTLSTTDSDWENLIESSGRSAFAYTLFSNITSIFPLLGIFGTICSLARLTGATDISANFATALDTTIYGLLGAMLYKFFDPIISSELDRALDEAEYLIHKHDESKLKEKKEKSHAPQAETGYRY